MCLMFDQQLEVNGDITTLVLTSLRSQTEYNVAVTPVYDEGPGNTMIGSAITGRNSFGCLFFIGLYLL